MRTKIRHLGLIIDGNRRYALKRDISLQEAYVLGAKKVDEVVRFVFGKTNIREVSIYALSADNLKRALEESRSITLIQEQTFDLWAQDKFFARNGIKVRFVGDIGKIPDSNFRESCIRLQTRTAKNKPKLLNILILYDPFEEALQAVSEIRIRNNAVSAKEMVMSRLQVKDDVDFIIRTAGGSRLSGFLMLQSAYAELYPIKKLWPEITVGDVSRAIRSFEGKEIKHGR